jgi:hypothetical protein
MEERKYKVLWIDDEYAKQEEFIELAYQNNIDICAFKSFHAGFDEFETHIEIYDAIILDARGFIEENQVDGTEHLSFLMRSISKLKDLESQIRREIPYVIYSGQTDVHEDGMFKEMYPNETVFSKFGDDEKLFAYLKEEIKSKSPEISKLKFKHRNVFEVFDEKYKLDKSWEASLVGLLIDRESGSTDVKQINEFRKFIEVIQKGLCAHGFIPDNFSVNNLKKFIKGEQVNGVLCSDLSIFGKVMPKLIESFIDNTQEGSHPLSIDAHIRQTNSRYFLDKLFYELLEILVCYKLWVDTNLVSDTIPKRWIRMEEPEFVDSEIVAINPRNSCYELMDLHENQRSIVPKNFQIKFNIEGMEVGEKLKRKPKISNKEHSDEIIKDNA